MVKRMQGVSAHIVNIKPNKWIYNNTCKYYLSNGHCDRRPKTKCTGATHCIMYEEKETKTKKKTIRTSKSNKSSSWDKHLEKKEVKKKFQVMKNKKYLKKLTKGQKIYHNKFKEGTIVNIDKLTISINFNGKVRKFNLSHLIDNNLIRLL